MVNLVMANDQVQSRWSLQYLLQRMIKVGETRASVQSRDLRASTTLVGHILEYRTQPFESVNQWPAIGQQASLEPSILAFPSSAYITCLVVEPAADPISGQAIRYPFGSLRGHQTSTIKHRPAGTTGF